MATVVARAPLDTVFARLVLESSPNTLPGELDDLMRLVDGQDLGLNLMELAVTNISCRQLAHELLRIVTTLTRPQL